MVTTNSLDLLDRAQAHIRMMAPHQKERAGGALLVECVAEVRRLQDLLFRMGAMREPPCFCCGYNGPGYYDTESHPCAAMHHAATGS